MHLGSPPSDPLHNQGNGADPGKPMELPQSYSNAPGADRGRPREAYPITMGFFLHEFFLYFVFHNQYQRRLISLMLRIFSASTLFPQVETSLVQIL